VEAILWLLDLELFLTSFSSVSHWLDLILSPSSSLLSSSSSFFSPFFQKVDCRRIRTYARFA